ncbi:UDP-N-acetylmuramoyl-tripeptide--D-alanyl-D-alanine ligase [Acetobacteraceae bacterium ESL0709]|nr:UDP-N-acetylmuramoyl-tripeptide--D-alanyl-D-alanine ligase [Acetobacteraceae bacterium ESL0697]MDF7678380.1 UDP-N-acetylmuramoyl-tripeptide--D-alanyl-D-alanine ligase [Acetobacteraceae bacterium ESL0709]
MKFSSPLWTSPELRAATKGVLTTECDITGVSIDTRTLQKNDLFIALKGDHSDGHRFIRQALEQGAGAVMAHDNSALEAQKLQNDPRILLVSDTMKGLEELGRFARQRFKGKAIAISGSVGKTTTKEMLRHALAPHGKVHASVASFNNHWGVPLTLARLPRDADFCINEIGMNHTGEIAPLVAQVRPDCAIITAIGTAHLGLMGSHEAIAHEKASLFAGLNPEHSFALMPDNTGYEELARHYLPSHALLWLVGFSGEATIHIENPVLSDTGSRFHLHIRQKTISVTLTLPGLHHIRNAALTLGCIAGLGLELEPSVQALKNFAPDRGRGATVCLGKDITLIDESYNASSDSIRAALKTLALRPATRRIAALGDMLELGEFARSEHESLAPDICACEALCFCCGPHMKALFESLPPELKGGYAENSTGLIPLIAETLHPGDILLVKGSLGSQMKKLIEGLETTFRHH